MPANWTTSSQAAAVNGVKALIYSEAGAGKTVLCATAPQPCIISAESGLLSLSKHNLERLYGIGNPNVCYDIPVWQVSTLQDVIDAYIFFASNPQARYFKTICIDSISEIAEKILEVAKRGVKDPRQAYGELIDKMLSLVRSFRDLPGFNVYMSAKMEPHKDENGVTKYIPSLPGSKLGPQLPYFFDEVFRLGIAAPAGGQKYRFLQTDGDAQYTAKDRSGVLDPVERPDLTFVFNKILGGKQ